MKTKPATFHKEWDSKKCSRTLGHLGLRKYIILSCYSSFKKRHNTAYVRVRKIASSFDTRFSWNRKGWHCLVRRHVNLCGRHGAPLLCTLTQNKRKLEETEEECLYLNCQYKVYSESQTSMFYLLAIRKLLVNILCSLVQKVTNQRIPKDLSSFPGSWVCGAERQALIKTLPSDTKGKASNILLVCL